MQLRHVKTVLSAEDGPAKVSAIAWSLNNNKLAVATADRIVHLFDDQGEKKDKFPTKPADSSLGKKCYQITALAFSPDSNKIALGQSDNIVFVYRVGDSWGEKKAITAKVSLQSAATCLIWPHSQQSFVVGQANGKVCVAGAKGNKAQVLYATDSYVVSIAASPSGLGIISGHADGVIIRYFFDDQGSGLSQGPLCRHSCAPTALAWGSTVVAAGADQRVSAYGKDGKVVQHFDYSQDSEEKEFVSAVSSPSGHTVVLGSFDRLRIFNWLPRRELWEEAPLKTIPNLYTITALAWKRDGSRLTLGSLCGGVETFEYCLKRVVYKNKFEMTYVGLSQVIVKELSSSKRVILRSHYGYEIDKVQIMGKDRYLVARTSDTLLLGDLATFKLSEVAWHGSGGNEKFYFENENVCMIFNAGELCLVEYGANDLLGSVRTEFTNPHLISVRINERKRSEASNCKHMAYLVDLHTVAVVNLASGAAMLNFTHDSKINWLELNETGTKLLFRDKKLRLFFVDVSTEVKTSLLSYCSYVQWVPQSDVVVAQNQGSLCIWYNIDNTDKVSTFSIQGDIVNLERREGKTEVFVQSGVDTISYALDEGLVEFGTAIEDKDYQRGLLFLEGLEMSSETETMWKTLASLTLKERKLKIAQRCFAALGDVSKVRYLQEINSLADRIEAETGHSGLEHYQVQCKLALLDKEFKTAESLLLEQGLVEEAMTMYRTLHKWDQALAVARNKLHPELGSLEEAYLKWLLDSRQEEKAGELKEHNRDYSSAVSLYMKAGLPAKAARILMSHEDLASQQSVVESVATALKSSELYEMAGEMYETVRMLQQALQAYRAGKDFRRAVELARAAFPGEVVGLEEEWGDHLVGQKQYDAAIKHFIQAGANGKAIEAAIQARQWSKAVQIIDVQEQEVGGQYYQRLAEHYASVKNYQLAEKYFTKAGMERQLEEMYFEAGQWETAYRIAASCMSPEEIQEKYCAKAASLEGDGFLRDAERLFVVAGEHDKAISMYKNSLQYEHMIRLVQQHHNELLNETHLHLAQELEWKGQWNQAEQHYLSGGDWKGAVNMYRAHGLWDDAYRISKAQGGQGAANQVAYLWAKSLGGESAVKLLSKFGLLEAAIDYATDNLSFDFAFEIARTALKSKLPEIHLKYALYLEDEGKYADAEGEFVRGGKPKEAVLMWVHQQDWDAAQRVAEQHCPDSVADVFVGQARAAFEKKDYHKAEGYLLRAERPDLAVKYYKDAAMWDDALRIVKEYMPNKLDEFQGEMATAFGNNTDDILSQAHSWEQGAEYRRAVEMYLKLTTQNCSDHALLKRCWVKAVDLSSKFIQDKALDVVALVCDRMANIQEYEQAGELYMRVDMVKEGLDMFMAGESWDKARNIARNVAPRHEQYVEDAYITYLKANNRTDEMRSVDPESALKMYAENGEWKKCLELAEKQGQKVLAKYVAMNAAHLITTGGLLTALQLFTKFGAPANPQNFNIYKKLCQDIFAMNLEGQAVYRTFAELRDMLLNLSANLARSAEAGSASAREFNQLLLVVHYLAARAACDSTKQLGDMAAKISVSLLRYTNLLPSDRAFLVAGNRAKEQGWENMSFVFYNRFLDLSEAIEEGNFDLLDNTDFADTDIPMEVPLPEQPCLAEDEREDIKEWVLALSMDQRVDRVLPLDERGTYVASLLSPKTNIQSLPCVVSGYPVLRNKMEFKRAGFVAAKEDWSRFVTTAKSTQNRECQDVLLFLNKWCGAPNNPVYSFK